MNHVSKTHQRFSEYLNNPRGLTNPEDFLGPNYKEVLNFWLILDDLSQEQLRVVKERYLAFYNENRSEWRKTADLAWEAAKEVVSKDYVINASMAAWSAWDFTNYVSSVATTELIGMHKILEDHQQPLTFFNMFLEVL